MLVQIANDSTQPTARRKEVQHMDSTVEKVLILTLGTGLNLSRDENIEIQHLSERDKKNKMLEIFSSNKFNYINATYLFPETAGEQQEIKSEFVAKPLVQLEKPKQIFMIGTVKSSWSSFYNRFAVNRNFENYYRLFEIENDNGKDTEGKRLKEIAKIIEEIYREDDVLTNLYPEDEPPVDAEIHILLTKYGLNDEELEYNYEIISSMEKCLKEDRQYQVSFDITHSFRSTPIYSLVILNYLKHITKYQIEISHVYYGNLEVSRETGKAHIVDLGDLVGVLELTNGVGEFRDTGNAVALLRELLDSENELKTALERFDWATQINDYQEIIDSVRTLREIVNEPSETKSRYTDLRDMLNAVLNEQFGYMLELKEDDPDDMAKIQLCISHWYQSQNRYGLAIATALEALRSFLVTFYLRTDNELDAEIKIKDCRTEDYRKAAIDRLSNLARSNLSSCVKEGKTKDISGELELLCKIEKLRVPSKKIRDRFAHNLSPDQSKADEDSEAFEPNSDDKETISEFIGALDELFNSSKENIAKAYCLRTKKKSGSGDKGTRLIICKAGEYEDNYRGLWEYGFLKKNASDKKKFDVCFINRELAEMISGSQNKKELARAARLLVLLIKESFGLGNEDLDVVLAGLEFRQCLLCSTVLRKNGIKVSRCQYSNNLPVSPQEMALYEMEKLNVAVEPDSDDINDYNEMKDKWETADDKNDKKPYYEFCELFQFLENK